MSDEPTETVRARIAGALKLAGKSLGDVQKAVNEEPGSEFVSFSMIAKICRGSDNMGPKALRIRAQLANLTGRTVSWLYMLEEKANDRSNSGSGEGTELAP